MGVAVLSLLDLPSARAEAPPAGTHLGVGATFDTLQVGPVTYHQVQVRSVSVRSIIILHAGGMASIPLQNLPPELQARFGYNPAAASAADEALRQASARAAQQRQEELRAAAARQKAQSGGSKFDNLLLSFGQPPEIRNEVDLQQEFFKLELGVKNQGRRPSCAIFAVVCALEFQNAEITGHTEKLSEEYLIWAVCKTLNRTAKSTGPVSPQGKAADDDEDLGFSLSEVVTALRTYGIPLQDSMPDTLGGKYADIGEPTPAIINEARNRRTVHVYEVPGRDNTTRIDNIIQALNSGIPVAIGVAWPSNVSPQSGYLSVQNGFADWGHAITLVGYTSTSGRIEDTVFTFKNSWGPHWAMGGYGHATYDFLQRNLHDAVLLEVLRPDAAK